VLLTERRNTPVEVRQRSGDKRRIFELASRNARLALDQDRLRAESGARSASRRSSSFRRSEDGQLPMRIECFDISNLGETHTVASMVVLEGGAPKKSDYRASRFAKRRRTTCRD